MGISARVVGCGNPGGTVCGGNGRGADLYKSEVTILGDGTVPLVPFEAWVKNGGTDSIFPKQVNQGLPRTSPFPFAGEDLAQRLTGQTGSIPSGLLPALVRSGWATKRGSGCVR